MHRLNRGYLNCGYINKPSNKMKMKSLSKECNNWIRKNCINSIEGIKAFEQAGFIPDNELEPNYSVYLSLIFSCLGTNLFPMQTENKSRMELLEDLKCMNCENVENDQLIWFPCGCVMHQSCFENHFSKEERNLKNVFYNKKINATLCSIHFYYLNKVRHILILKVILICTNINYS